METNVHITSLQNSEGYWLFTPQLLSFFNLEIKDVINWTFQGLPNGNPTLAATMICICFIESLSEKERNAHQEEISFVLARGYQWLKNNFPMLTNDWKLQVKNSFFPDELPPDKAGRMEGL